MDEDHTDRERPAGSARGAGDLALRDDINAVLRLGACLAGAGTGSYRVRRAMHRTARSLGIDEVHTSVTMTDIVVTARRGEDFRTVVREVRGVGVDAARITALERLSRTVRPGPDMSAAHIEAALDRVAAAPRRWARWQVALAAGVGCGAFAVLNGFGAFDVPAVVLAAALGQVLRAWLTARHVNALGVVAACAVLACLTYLGLAAIAVPGAGVAPSNEAGFVAAVLFLIPGFPMFTALLDIAHLDFAAGAGRLLYAVTIVTVASGSAWLVASVAGASPREPVTGGAGSLTHLAVVAAASVVGVGGFALLFNSGVRMILLAATFGAVANVGRVAAVEAGVSPQVGCLLGGLSIGLLAAVAAKRAGIPRITVSVPAAIIMIPGTTMFRALYHLNAGDIGQFLSYSTTAALLVAAIGGGLVLARLLSDPWWTLDRPIDLHAYHDAPRP